MREINILGHYDIMVQKNDEVEELREIFADCINKARQEGISERLIIKMEAAFESTVGMLKLLLVDDFDNNVEIDELQQKFDEVEDKWEAAMEIAEEELE